MFHNPDCKVCGGDAPVKCWCHDNHVVHGTSVYHDGETWCYVLLENGKEMDGCEGFGSQSEASEALAEFINR